MENKVSVIVPVHNCEDCIEETISSILSQTYQNFEIIVVDDFSKDKSVEKIEAFNDKRIFIYKNDECRGAAYSRNLAISKATGDYIAFLDGDDVWEKEKLSKQLKFMIDNNYEFSATAYRLMDENGKLLGKVIHAPKKMTFKIFKRTNYIGCLTAMYKRDAYPELAIPNDIYKRNDYALWLLLSKKCTCYFLDETLAKYRKHTGNASISSGSKTKLFKFEMIMLQKILGYSKFHSFFGACKITLFYFLKRLKYIKKEK